MHSTSRAHPDDLAERRADLVDDVRPVGPEPTAALGLELPPVGQLGRGVGVGRELELEEGVARLADHAGSDRARELRLAGAEAELGAEQVHDTGALGGVEHLSRFRRVERERLLAHHVLPRADRLQHDRTVRARRRDDGDDVDPRERDRVTHARRRGGDAETRGSLGGLRLVAADQCDDVDAGRAHRAQVREDAEAGPDHHGTNGRVAPVDRRTVTRCAFDLR
jgi:hypothetical protein